MACGYPDARTFQDEGAVCLGMETSWPFVVSGPIEAGEEHSVMVVFSECISTCAVNVQTSCSIEAT